MIHLRVHGQNNVINLNIIFKKSVQKLKLNEQETLVYQYLLEYMTQFLRFCIKKETDGFSEVKFFLKKNN